MQFPVITQYNAARLLHQLMMRTTHYMESGTSEGKKVPKTKIHGHVEHRILMFCTAVTLDTDLLTSTVQT
jgi:hypothetical protein